MKTIYAVWESSPDIPNEIQSFMHCQRCAKEKPSGVSPAEWAKLSVGVRADGSVQVWCERHQLNVGVMTLTDQRPSSGHEIKPGSCIGCGGSHERLPGERVH